MHNMLKKKSFYLFLRTFLWAIRSGEMFEFIYLEKMWNDVRQEFYSKYTYRPKRILIAPAFPSYDFNFYRIIRILGLKMSNMIRKDVDLAIDWRLDTERKPLPFFDALPQGVRLINQKCRDIGKKNVGKVFFETFGYELDINPLTYHGKCVIKSNINATHDGRIVECPLDHKEEGLVYQKFINIKFSDELFYDFRVPIFGNTIPCVFQKYYAADQLFKKYKAMEIKETAEVFSDDQIEKIMVFCRNIGMDYGELDIVRDEDRRIYIVDANTTPFRLRYLDNQTHKKAMFRLAEAFYKEFIDA